MLRKSNSLSQIPVRLFDSGKNECRSIVRSRSKSVARLSRTDNSNLLKPIRKSSLDRKSHLSVKQTPIRSLQRTTPGSIKSSCSSKSRVNYSPALATERVTIQKLSTNKTWVTSQFTKVQAFIENSDLFDVTVITPKALKPPSIKVFIYVVSILFKQLFSSVYVTSENYKEEIVQKLKALHYPGTIANSMLKTVNTMNSWPQVIGMFGWLIDKIQLADTDTIDYSIIPAEEKFKYLLLKLCESYIFEKYRTYNETKEMERSDEIDNRFISQFSSILNINIETFQKMKIKYEESRKLKNTLLMEIEEQSDLKMNLELKKSELLKTLSDMEESHAAEDCGLEAELQTYTSQLNTVNFREDQLKANVVKLEQSIKNQLCTYKEKKDLLDNIKIMKNEINIVKEKMQQAETIKNEYDGKVYETREELQSKVVSWNRSLMEICIKKPSLKSLLLKETGLYRKEFLDEIREVLKVKMEIVNKLVKEIETMEININGDSGIITNIEKELKSMQDDIDKMNLATKQLYKDTSIIEEDTTQKLTIWREQTETILASMKESEEKKQLEWVKEKNEQLNQRNDRLIEKLENFKIIYVTFFIGLHEQVSNNIVVMKNILTKIKNEIEAALRQDLEEKDDFNRFLETLISDK